MSGGARRAVLALAVWLGPQAAGAQGPPGATPDLALLDFARAPLGAIPTATASSARPTVALGPGGAPLPAGRTASAGSLMLMPVEGTLDVVDHLGQRMLRASTRATLLLQLPAGTVLPQDFTVAVDLVPKAGGQPEDLALEGTRTIAQGQNRASANLHWHSEAIRAIGGGPDPDGGPTFDRPMPEDVTAAVAGQFTRVVFTFAGDLVTVYTNGRQVYAIPDRRFVRGGVLRVFLGANQDDAQPVYLARLRVTSGAWTPAMVATAGAGTAQHTAALPASANPLPNALAALPATSTSVTALPARSLSLPGFAASGVFGALPPRTVALTGFSATGAVVGGLAPRTVALPGFSAAGVFGALSPRTMALQGFTASGVFLALAPRTLTLPGFNASGVFASLAPRTISLAGFTATGSHTWLAPRTIALTGFAAAGVFGALAPRTLTLPGWTATGDIPPP